MKIDDAREYILSKKGAWEDYPFDDVTPVFKVDKKMFALFSANLDRPSMNLKYPKEKMMDLRMAFEDIIPGYHMNKDHWNTLYLDGDLDDGLIKDLIDVSYDLVFKSLTKKAQKAVLEKIDIPK